MPLGPIEPFPSSSGSGETPVAVDIAGPEKIRSTRTLLADASGKLRFLRLSPEQRQNAGRTLSAAELKFSRAVARFLTKYPQVGEAAGVPATVFDKALETDLALARMARAAGEIEATSAIGEIFLKARLTDQNDRVILYADSKDMSPSERDALRTYLASTDLIYERQLQLLQMRKQRMALRKEKHAEEIARTQEGSEKLRKREILANSPLPRK